MGLSPFYNDWGRAALQKVACLPFILLAFFLQTYYIPIKSIQIGGIMNRVEHFDILADDPERAINFYSDVFGWKIEKWEGPTDYWLVTTGPDDQAGINGGIGKREDPAQSVINTIGVASLDEFVEKITAAGGKVVAPKMTIPGVGYFALCQDTEGNSFGLMEEDTSAK